LLFPGQGALANIWANTTSSLLSDLIGLS